MAVDLKLHKTVQKPAVLLVIADLHGSPLLFVKEIFIDSTLKAVDVQDLECFIKKLDKLAAFAETKITLSVSMDESELPAGVKEIVTCI